MEIPENVKKYSAAIQEWWKRVYADVFTRTNNESLANSAASSVLHKNFVASDNSIPLFNFAIPESLDAQSKQVESAESGDSYFIHGSIGFIEDYCSGNWTDVAGYPPVYEDVVRAAMTDPDNTNIPIHDVHITGTNDADKGTADWMGINEKTGMIDFIWHTTNAQVKWQKDEDRVFKYSVGLATGYVDEDNKFHSYIKLDANKKPYLTKMKFQHIGYMTPSVAQPLVKSTETFNHVVATADLHSKDTPDSAGESLSANKQPTSTDEAMESGQDTFNAGDNGGNNMSDEKLDESLVAENAELKATLEAMKLDNERKELLAELASGDESKFDAFTLEGIGITAKSQFEVMSNAFTAELEKATADSTTKITELEDSNKELMAQLTAGAVDETEGEEADGEDKDKVNMFAGMALEDVAESVGFTKDDLPSKDALAARFIEKYPNLEGKSTEQVERFVKEG